MTTDIRTPVRFPYEPGPWTVVDGVIQSSSTLRPVAEVVRELEPFEGENVTRRWRANERLISLAPELADSLRDVKRCLEIRISVGHMLNNDPADAAEREILQIAERLLNGIGRLQIRSEIVEGVTHVNVLITENRCHIVLNDDMTICKRPLVKDGKEFMRRVSWQAACELYDCPGCEAFVPSVEF